MLGNYHVQEPKTDDRNEVIDLGKSKAGAVVTFVFPDQVKRLVDLFVDITPSNRLS